MPTIPATERTPLAVCMAVDRLDRYRRGPRAGHAPAPGPGQLTPLVEGFVRELASPGVRREGGVAVVRVDGPVVSESAWLFEWIPAISSRELSAVLRQLRADRSVSAVILSLDCPGWGVMGSDEVVDELRALAAEKNLWAHVDGLAASGGMWMAAECDEVSAARSAELGHIGTLVLGYDTSELFKAAGIRPVVVASHPDKAVGWPGVAFSESWAANMREIVDQHHAEFVAAVAAGRGMDEKAVRDLNVRMFAGEAAVQAGLADRIESLDAMIGRALAAAPKRPGERGSTRRGSTGASDGSKETSMTVKELREKHADMVAQIEAEAVEKAKPGLVEAARKEWAAAAEKKASAPASFEALNEAFGAKDKAFVAECQERRLTMPQAHAAWAERCEKKAAEAASAAQAAEAELRKRTPGGAGAEPVGAGNRGGGGGAYEDVCRQVAAAEKLDIRVAMARVAKSHQQLHADWIKRNCPAIAAA